MKRQKTFEIENGNCLFDLLSEEIVFVVLDFLPSTSLDRKSFSLVSKSFYSLESKHRKSLKPLRQNHLPRILKRYPHINHLDLSLCPRLELNSLTVISNACANSLRSIDLSRSRLIPYSGLINLTWNCKNLVEIDLSNATELVDSAVVAVTEAKNLERLWLARCKLITDIGVGSIAVACNKLKLVNLKWCLGVTDLGVGLIAVKCKEIRSLDLSYLPITDASLSLILELQHIEDLVVEGCLGIVDQGLVELEQKCPSLKKLDMSNCENISHVGLSSLVSKVGCLEELILAYGSPVNQSIANSLKKFPALQSVKLDSSTVTSAGLNTLGNSCLSLKELSLRKCGGVTDEALSCLVAKHSELKKLDITCCRKITDICIDRITSSCPSLTSLQMESCILVSSKAFILIGQRCEFLEELDLTDNEIDDQGLKSISRCSKLSILKLGICLNISNNGLAHIGMNCRKLTELDLYRSVGISDLGISAIASGCIDLKTINMSYCKDVTDSSLISLSKCLRLSTIESRGCPLITSFGLAAIADGCKQLSKLDIKKCHNIDDSGMFPLSHFSQKLRQINLSYSSVTDVGLLSLARISCLQNLTLLHVNGLTPSGLGAALLACGGLTKAKLHASFKGKLPQRLCDHLEARGCVFEWRDKEFKAELDPKCWKTQLTDMDP